MARAADLPVHGGTGGIEAYAEDLLTVAGTLGRLAGETAAAAARLHLLLGEATLSTASLLDPVGAARFGAAWALAVDGPGGMLAVAAEAGALDGVLHAAAAAYPAADRLAGRVSEVTGALEHLGPALATSVLAVASGHPAAAPDRFAAADADLVGLLSAGVLAASTPMARNGTAPGLGLLVRAADGHPEVQDAGPSTQPEAARPPRSMSDLMRALAERDGGRDGEIDVRILTRPGGGRSVIVDLPGTKSWDPLPNADVTSLTTNVLALSGASTSYQRGVIAAMRKAGVRAGDPVLLVGHSEGGMVAVDTAAALARSGEFSVAAVVTAGAPIGRTVGRLPRSVPVLALENRSDIVPRLDGTPNPDRRNVTTVTVDHPHGEVLANHDLTRSYVPGAADADASTDPSIGSFRAALAPFFDADAVSAERFVITRGY